MCATQLHLDDSMPRFSDMDWDSMGELKLATPYKPVASLPCIEAAVSWHVKISNKKGMLWQFEMIPKFIAWWVCMIQFDLDWISSSSLFSRVEKLQLERWKVFQRSEVRLEADSIEPVVSGCLDWFHKLVQLNVCDTFHIISPFHHFALAIPSATPGEEQAWLGQFQCSQRRCSKAWPLQPHVNENSSISLLCWET